MIALWYTMMVAYVWLIWVRLNDDSYMYEHDPEAV